MAELADAPDSKSGSRKRVGVRPSLWAPSVQRVSVGLARSFSRSGGDRIVREAESNLRHMSSVDMSEWVTYILWLKSDEEVSMP
jgi:hypothetical protein